MLLDRYRIKILEDKNNEISIYILKDDCRNDQNYLNTVQPLI